MPGRKRKGGGGGGGKRRKADTEEANPFDLEEMDTAEFDEEEQDIALNRTKQGGDELLDPLNPYQRYGVGIDANAGADVDIDEAQEAEEEQKRRMEALNEEDFNDDDFADVIDVKTSKTSKRSKTKQSNKESLNDLSALTKFLSKAEGIVAAEQVAVDHSSLSHDAKQALLKSNAPELLTMLAEFKEKLTLVKDTLSPVLHKVRSGELPTGEGVSFLEMKMQLFITYLMHLTFYFLLKAEGKPVKDSPVVQKLVELRAYIDKLKPIEKKLQHQISRLLSRAAIAEAGGEVGQADRADVGALAEVKASGNDVYSAPRGGATGLTNAEKEERESRRLTVSGKNRSMAEETMMSRTTNTKKSEKLLKNAKSMNLTDTSLLQDDDSEEDMGVGSHVLNATSIMDLVKSRKERHAAAAKKAKEAEEEEDEDEDEAEGDDEEDDEEEDSAEEDSAEDEQRQAKEFYEEEMKRTESEKKRKKRALNAARQHGGKKVETFGEREGEVIDGHRKISSEINRNKGLVASRPKKFKNPRVRSKHRATKLANKVKSQVPSKGHLRTDIVRSIPLK
eukprot:TRINITY_DN7515_c0_g1_i1.p1 TRINITY_DN7515_c0_g1~~TRINITY_DN7515_c0_g1_i1.p1  ORF type:complete len:563 (+),score=216.61 TRINITY_DN7515_c0_g1_i1:80-1768(+)